MSEKIVENNIGFQEEMITEIKKAQTKIAKKYGIYRKELDDQALGIFIIFKYKVGGGLSIYGDFDYITLLNAMHKILSSFVRKVT